MIFRNHQGPFHSAQKSSLLLPQAGIKSWFAKKGRRQPFIASKKGVTASLNLNLDIGFQMLKANLSISKFHKEHAFAMSDFEADTLPPLRPIRDCQKVKGSSMTQSRMSGFPFLILTLEI